MNESIELSSVNQTHKVGLFSIGLDTYWAQFPGLLDRLTSYNRAIAASLAASGSEVVNLGMVDSLKKRSPQATPSARRTST